MSRTYCLTGGTGFLGSRLSVALLERGDRVVFLGRSKDRTPLTERIRNNLAAADPSLISRSSFQALAVDLGKTDLGLPPSIIDSLKKMGIDGIWHAAANLSFEEGDREKVFATNLLGAQNVLALSEKLGAPLFHISTAYVHGQRRGHILEADLVRPRSFNNVYEESKFEAERLLRATSSFQKLVIFRPSILVGKGTTDRLSVLGYYAVLDGVHRCKVQLLREFRRQSARSNAPLRFPVPLLCSRSSRLNLMPLDVATKLMLQIAESPASAGKTYHITNPNPFSMADVARQTFEALGLDSTVIDAPRWMTGMYLSALTRMGGVTKCLPAAFLRKLALYRNYMVQNNTYDMQNTGRIVGEDLGTMFQFNSAFVKERAGEFLAALQEERASVRRSYGSTRQRIPVPVEAPWL